MFSSFTSFFSRSSASPPDLPDPLDAPPAPAAASARVTASASLPSLADRTRTDVPALVPSGGPSRRDGLQDPQSSDPGRGREPSGGTSQSGSTVVTPALHQGAFAPSDGRTKGEQVNMLGWGWHAVGLDLAGEADGRAKVRVGQRATSNPNKVSSDRPGKRSKRK